MEEFVNALHDIDTPLVVFLMLFSMGIAIFQTVILSSLLERKFPSWFFFVFNPLLLGIGYLIYTPLAGIFFLFLFASIFILAILLFVVNGFKGLVISIKEQRKANKPLWKIVVGVVASIIFIPLFLFLGPYTFILIFAVIILQFLLPNSSNRFQRLQAILPTSPIRSMAMGLVEVRGKLEVIETREAPIGSAECIGYRYLVEDISRDDDGRESFSTIKDEVICNDFYISDSTGRVKVSAKSLDFLWIPLDETERRSSKRYSQYLLKGGMEVFLIGMASSQNGEPILVREKVKDIFTIAPVDSVDRWNQFQPLLRSLVVAGMTIAVLVIFILVANVSLGGNIIHIHFDGLTMNWSEIFNFIK